MKSTTRWSRADASFWHHVRILSEHLGYSRRRTVLRHSHRDILDALRTLNLNYSTSDALIYDLVDYFNFRANLIENEIANYLQDSDQARLLFDEVAARYTSGYTSQIKHGSETSRIYNVIEGVPTIAPFNKQKGNKRDIDFLTATSNILISHYLQGDSFDADPRKLPVFTDGRTITSSMSRRMDGAYPHCTNPIALWEFKCYYYTTTFGSKISDAVYIADLDGYERYSTKAATGSSVHLSLFIDAYSTWMQQGKSYLCRIIDLLQRGAIDELIVGSEVTTAIPEMVEEWRTTETFNSNAIDFRL